MSPHLSFLVSCAAQETVLAISRKEILVKHETVAL